MGTQKAASRKPRVWEGVAYANMLSLEGKTLMLWGDKTNSTSCIKVRYRLEEVIVEKEQRG